MKQAIIILLLLCAAVISAAAQPVITPRNMALGGGGSTYITDYNANFYNPANLMIQDRTGTFSFGIGIGGFYMNATENYTNLNDQLDNSRDYLGMYSFENTGISGSARSQLLEENFPGRTILSENRTRYDATLLGMKWFRNNRAYSIALRTRTSSNFRVGKGWYSNTFEETNSDNLLLERSLIHRQETLHEISFGYAESFQFLTGLTPRLDNFIIGIAPKLVFGGNYQNAEWNNKYEQLPGGNIRRIQNFSYDATGEFGASALSYLGGATPEQAATNAFSNAIFSMDGIGAGLDIGVTYLLTLGSDLSAVRRDQQPTQRSLRLSFAMTDIGFVSYSNNEISISASADTTASPIVPSNVANETFTGARGQYINFIETNGEDNPFTSSSFSRESFSTLLPMAIHGGALLEINRLKLMGDVSIGLTNNAFNSTKLTSSLGLEIRPLQFMPLRGGIHLIAQRPEFLSVGTAIETKHWDLSLAAQFTPNSLINTPSVTGIAIAALQFRF